MKFFVDTADIKQIEELIPTGFVDGVTTNPSLIAKQGKDMKEIIKNICSLISGPVSAEVTAIEYDSMLKEAEYLVSIAKKFHVVSFIIVSGTEIIVPLSHLFVIILKSQIFEGGLS